MDGRTDCTRTPHTRIKDSDVYVHKHYPEKQLYLNIDNFYSKPLYNSLPEPETMTTSMRLQYGNVFGNREKTH